MGRLADTKNAVVPGGRGRGGGNSSSSYRDDPDAVSLHTTRGDYDYDDVPELPSYTDSVAADGVAPEPSTEQPPQDEYRNVYPPFTPVQHFRRGKNASGNQKIGQETSIRMEERLMDPDKLSDYLIMYLSRVPPAPFVRVQGWHWETIKRDNKKETNKVYDFDIALGLQHWLITDISEQTWWTTHTVENSDSVHRGTIRPVRAPGYKQDIEIGAPPKLDLQAWCEDFSTNKSALKVFRLTRNITGLHTQKLTEALIPLVRSTNYRGHIDISYPVANRNVEIYSPHWINRARLSWVRWLFYLSFLWLLTWPILFLLTKRWHVYSATWRFSRWVKGPGEHEPAVLQYATISEETWLARHRRLLLSLVLDKFHGDATDMGLEVDVEAAMGRANAEVFGSSGNAGVDAAVGLFRGGLSAWNAVNGRPSARSGGGWGMDLN